MADLSDVEQAIVSLATGIIYPLGSSESSIVGVTCRIYRGWPNSATLNSDLNNGFVNITVSSDNDSGKTTTRYLEEWQVQTSQSGLVLTASGSTLTITGVAAVGDVVGALIDGIPFVYRIMAGDNPGLVAANLCASIALSRIASVNGTVITIPGAHSIIGRTVADSLARCEVRRQEKDVRTIFWCPTPAVRDFIAGALDCAFAGSPFLSLPDGTLARMAYRNTSTYDQSQNALLYRRDVVYCTEYPTILTADLASMLFGKVSVNSAITFG